MKSTLFVIVAIVLFIKAGLPERKRPDFEQVVRPENTIVVANTAKGLTSLGYSLAGGLSLIASALAMRNESRNRSSDS